MFWFVLGLAALAIALLVAGMVKPRAAPPAMGAGPSAMGPSSSSTSQRDDAAFTPPPSAAPPAATGSRQSGNMRDASDPADDGGTTMASDAKSGRSRVSMTTQSTEIDISMETGEGEEVVDDDPTGPVARILVSAVGGTDQGKKRKHNEDAYVVLPAHSLFAIADGMGGYAAGEVASQMAVDVLKTSFEQDHFGGAPIAGLPRRGDELVRAIQSANSAILTQARENEHQQGMGTTLVAARFAPNRKRVYIAHVGDSRVYRLRDGQLHQLTTDHTLGAAGVTGPSAAKLSRAVGVFDDVEVDLSIDEPREGDHYVLCSDGLFKMVPDEKICEIIYGARSIQAAVDELIREANSRGGKDNVSVILVRVDEPDPNTFN
jgi:protein phosphatase